VFTTRKFIFACLLFAALLAFAGGDANYYCVVCGKGPLTGRILMSKWGPVCDDCAQLKDRCSICGLPVKDGDGHIKTPDGRFICKFDKTNAVLTPEQAKNLFEQTRDDAVDMYGPQFALKYADVTVSLFDVDYWSERGRENGLHKFGFASTRKTSGGQCTHEVVMLSGRTRGEMTRVAAHEYTHLWINENRPDGRVIDGETIEAICELTAYKLMERKNLPEMQKEILENPYTNGKIKTLVAVAAQDGMDSILNWVKNGTTASLDEEAAAAVAAPRTVSTNLAPPAPQTLRFTGLLIIGTNRQAVINGVAFSAGDTRRVKLQDKTVLVHCREIRRSEAVLELDGNLEPFTLKIGGEKWVP
jgi:hypothetical protein